LGFFFARTLATLCLSRKPKARVTTKKVLVIGLSTPSMQRKKIGGSSKERNKP